MTRITSLPHRALISIAGPDSAAFLKGLCTADIDAVTDDSAKGRLHSLHYGAFLRPQGKMVCDCILQAVSVDEIWLDVPLSEREELLAKLNMYKLRAKVTITSLDRPVYVAFGGDLPAGFSPDPRGAIIGDSFGFAYTPQAENADTDAWVAFRFQHGLSDPGVDFVKDELYPIDANLDLLDAIDFHKGCFIGQELTSRMKRRGQIKNRILPLRHDGQLVQGAEILLGERRIGEILNTRDGASLGLMRLDRLEGAQATSNGTDLEIDMPDWIKGHILTSV